MISSNTAESIILSSVGNLMEKNNGLTKQDLLKEIRNIICLYLLKSQRKEAAKATSIDSMLMNMLQDMQSNNYMKTTQIFSEAALKIFPQDFNIKDSLMMTFDVQESLSDPNQWELLKEYFGKYHNLDVDDL